MKIFNLSPHRSGTKSFTQFCNSAGFHSAHWLGNAIDDLMEYATSAADVWPVVKLIIPKYDVFSDLPWPIVYPFISDVDAKFVLIRRVPATWLASVRRHTAGRSLSYLESLFYLTLTGRYEKTLDKYSDDELLRRYMDFVVEIMMSKTDLGVFDLEDPNLSKALAEYLGISEQPFAHIID